MEQQQREGEQDLQGFEARDLVAVPGRDGDVLDPGVVQAELEQHVVLEEEALVHGVEVEALQDVGRPIAV